MGNQNKEKYSQDTIHFETSICRVLHRRRNIVFSIPGAPNITKNKLVKKKKKNSTRQMKANSWLTGFLLEYYQQNKIRR